VSNLAVGLVWQRSRAKGSNLLVLLGIADLAQDDGRDFWQSNERLQIKSRLTERSLRYIFAKLQRDREIVIRRNTERTIPAKSRGHIPERFIDIRCIYDWETYKTEGGKVFRVVKKGQGEKISNEATNNFQNSDQKLPASKRKDLLVDLSVDLKAVPLSRHAVEIATYRQLEKLVHEALDLEGFESIADLSDTVKTRIVRLGMEYDPQVLARAIASVTLLRGTDRRARKTS
jgi:hypothetical protein